MTERTIIPIGPYHALQEEPEFFQLHVEGERVVALDIELGYNHRGIEKISESKDYEETVFLVERICGICSTSHPIACVAGDRGRGRHRGAGASALHPLPHRRAGADSTPICCGSASPVTSSGSTRCGCGRGGTGRTC